MKLFFWGVSKLSCDYLIVKVEFKPFWGVFLPLKATGREILVLGRRPGFVPADEQEEGVGGDILNKINY